MENVEDVKTTVELYIYDLTKGIASMMSRLVIGKLKYLLDTCDACCFDIKSLKHDNRLLITKKNVYYLIRLFDSNLVRYLKIRF